jgi:hypothetical protein
MPRLHRHWRHRGAEVPLLGLELGGERLDPRDVRAERPKLGRRGHEDT